MSFIQIKLAKSVNQSRDIFDKFIYSPQNGDTIANITSTGYMLPSRYIDDPDWVGSIVEVEASDGYFFCRVEPSGDLVVVGAGAGSSSPPTSRQVTSDYQIGASDYCVISDGGNTGTLPVYSSAYPTVFVIKNNGVSSDTLIGNGGPIENGTSLTSGQARAFAAGASGWVEIT